MIEGNLWRKLLVSKSGIISLKRKYENSGNFEPRRTDIFLSLNNLNLVLADSELSLKKRTRQRVPIYNKDRGGGHFSLPSYAHQKFFVHVRDGPTSQNVKLERID